MPVEFLQQEPSGGSSHATRLVMMYDGSGRRISKTAMRMVGDDDWDTTLVTHYTGIGTETREYKPANFTRYTDSAGVEHCVSANPDYGGNASTACPLPDTVKAVIPLPHGLGRYALQDVGQVDENGAPQAFEWYLKNHLGSTMVVYGTGFPDPLGISPEGELRAAYDYRSFGEQLDLLVFTRKVTENFTGKEKDDETQLDYFGARYLDPMLGLWISVDPARQFASPYLYAGNGVNPVNAADPDGEEMYQFIFYVSDMDRNIMISMVQEALRFKEKNPSADYRITIAENQADLTRIINEGKYSVVFAHGLEDFDGNVMPNRFAMNDNESFDMTYQELNNGLNSDSYAKIFTCFSNWSDDFSNVSPARNPSSLEVPFIADYNAEVHGVNGAKDAANYLDRQYQRDNGYTYEAYPE